jgi:esterase
MELFHRDFGGESNPPLILLHGLLGSSRNWVTVGKLLSQSFHVVALDLRNHGQSPHDVSMDYPTLVQDVINWLDHHHFPRAHLVGHSMGGKVAMLLACTRPTRVHTLTIADIAPKRYAPHFRSAFDAMLQINPSAHTRISEVEADLAKHLTDATLRQFLVTNLKRNASGTFDWQVNLPALTRALPELADNPLLPGMRFEGPTLLLHGAQSDFVNPSDLTDLPSCFPNSQSVCVPGAGHNIHIDNRHFFAEQVLAFASA